MIFRRKDKNQGEDVRRSHLKNLMLLSMADGQVDEVEEHLLISIAHRLKLSETDVTEIKNDLKNIDFILPEKYEDRIEQFSDLLSIVAADGVLDPNEEIYVRKTAKKYELMDQVVEDMLAKYVVDQL